MSSGADRAVGLDGERKLVVFRLGRETYGIDIGAVAEIGQMQDITHVPKTPAFVEGIINVRGQVLPVIDLRKRFGLEMTGLSRESRIIQVEVGVYKLGLIVDAVTEVLPITGSMIEPTSPVISSIDTEFIQGVVKAGDRLIILINLEKVLSRQEQDELTEIA